MPKIKRKHIKVGIRVYAKLGTYSHLRMFIVTRIIDEKRIEIQDSEGITHTIGYKKIRLHPFNKPTPPERPSRSVYAISIPMGGVNKR